MNSEFLIAGLVWYVVFLLSTTCHEAAPYDPMWSDRYPRRAAWMSLAGPGANFALAILAGILIHVGIGMGFFRFPDSANFTHVVEPAAAGVAAGAATFVSLLFSLNLLLGIFNLFPVPPLDGFGVLGLLVSETLARRIQTFGRSLGILSMVGLLVVWQVFGPLFQPIFAFALRVLYPSMGYGS